MSGVVILLVYLSVGVLHAALMLRIRHVSLSAPIPDDLPIRRRDRIDKFRMRNMPGMMTTMNVILAVFLAIVGWPIGLVGYTLSDFRTAITGRIE